MKKIKCHWLFVVVSALFPLSSYAQESDSILAEIVRKFNDYTARIPREEIFIHTDKEDYIAGEDMWLKAYIIDRKSYRLSKNSRLIYLEILNSDDRPVIQKRIKADNGAGPGHLVLPDTLGSGLYTIRAYTNWMKNFLPFNCFRKDFAVFNPLKRDANDMLIPMRRLLPSINEQKAGAGISLKIDNERSDSLEIILEVINPDTDNYYLLIQSRGNLIYSHKLSSEAGFSKSLIPKSVLPEGISQVVISDSHKLLAEKLIYKPVTRNEILKITSDSSFGLRDNVSVDFQVVDPSLLPDEMSVSVSPLTPGRRIPDFQNYLVFGSEYNSAAGYITENVLSGLPIKETDSILAGLKSNWIIWPGILAGDIPEISYLQENEYHFLTGQITGGTSDTILMFTPGRGHSFQYTMTDSTGNFTFNIYPDEEEKDLILMPAGEYENRKILISSPFPEIYPESIGNYFSDTLSEEFFSRPGIDFQVRKLFKTVSADRKVKSQYTQSAPVGFYGIPDIAINLTEYVTLPDMGEVFLELVPDVSLRKKGTGYEVVISQWINDRRLVMKPSIMIDGVIVKDATLIAELDPRLVEKIEVITKKYLVGGFLFDGIVNVITRTADLSDITLPEYMTRTNYRIADPVPEFHSPDHSLIESGKNRIPDYRNVLYWNPMITTGAEFWSSDNKSEYIIHLSGVTEDGRVFSALKKISVE